jgi:dienelactone hydrolase
MRSRRIGLGFLLALSACQSPEPAVRFSAPALAAPNRTAADVRALLGLPLPPAPLESKVIQFREEEGLAIEELRFRAYPGVDVPGTLVRPLRPERRLPAIVCMPGTHGTREILTAPSLRFGDPPPAAGWARELARRGFVTLSLDYRGSSARGQGILSEATLVQLEGGSYLKYMVDEVTRAVDLLAGRPDVNAEKIGMTGFSLGGVLTWYSGAADPRLKVLVPVCGLCGTYRDLIRDVPRMRYSSQVGYPHGFLKAFPGDQPELFAGLAPRAVLVLGRDEDEAMPVQGLRTLASEVGKAYGAGHVGERFRVSIHPGRHQYSTEMFEEVAAWFDRFLKQG